MMLIDEMREHEWADKKTREYLKESRPDLLKKINEMIEMCDYDLTPFKKTGGNSRLLVAEMKARL